MHWSLWIAVGAVVLVLYFLPSILAALLKRNSTTSIVLMNLFLGWTGAGWLLAMIWVALGWGEKRGHHS